MTEFYVVYTASFVVPLMFDSWRIALFGLGLQGLLLGVVAVSHREPWSAQIAVEYTYLFLIRGIVVPYYLLGIAQATPPRGQTSLIRKDAWQWLFAGSLLVIAFMFGSRLCANSPTEAVQVGTAAGAVLIGMLILSNQDQRLGQVIGLLTFEGGITLIELLSPHAMPTWVGVGVSAVFLWLLLVCGQFLKIPQTGNFPDNPSGKDTRTS